jgi:hypothetical protein
MLISIQQVDSMDDLREYINTTICTQYQLQCGAFPMTERILRRGGKPCGMYFCLLGPRATQFSAIWETDRNQVLFYGSGGERYQKTQLTVAPELDRAAA